MAPRAPHPGRSGAALRRIPEHALTQPAAECDGQPVLAITGHTFHDLIGTHYQRDVDLDKLYGRRSWERLWSRTTAPTQRAGSVCWARFPSPPTSVWLALARGQKDRWEIIKTVVEDKVREVV